jgi:hypothetical protein
MGDSTLTARNDAGYQLLNCSVSCQFHDGSPGLSDLDAQVRSSQSGGARKASTFPAARSDPTSLIGAHVKDGRI